jgi:hypothetical protein
LAVPDLTRSIGIQLNDRVSLRRKAKAIAWWAPDIAPHPDPSMAKPSGDYIPLGGFISKAENPRCLDLFATKQVDGYPAKFMRFVGPDNFVIEVNGAERTETREYWRTLSLHEAGIAEGPSKVAGPG